MEDCSERRFEITNECGGAGYWWCNRLNKQVNIYEDCKECENIQYKDGSNWKPLILEGEQ